MLVIGIHSFSRAPEIPQHTCQTLCWGVTLTGSVDMGLAVTRGQLSVHPGHREGGGHAGCLRVDRHSKE